ncbi:MAG: TPM domain-containing protein [Lachnospiraceae bacterium]|nr:TPM domain-containing protein [Lachnospiraceae bacterium]
MDDFELNLNELLKTPEPEPVQEPKKRRKLSKAWRIVIICTAVIVALVIVGLLVWKPILYKVSPEAYLGVALKHSANSAARSTKNTPSGVLNQAIGYIPNGSVDMSFSLEQTGSQSVSLSLQSTADRASKKAMFSVASSIDQKRSNFRYYSDKNQLILDVKDEDNHFAYSAPYANIKEKLSDSFVAKTIGTENTDNLADHIVETRVMTELLWDFDKLLEPYMAAFLAELSNYPMESTSEERTINDKTGQYKAFKYKFYPSDLYKLGLSVTNEMRQQGSTPENEMIVHFLDGFVRGLYQITEPAESFEDAIDNIEKPLVDLRSTFGFTMEIAFYVDGLDVVETQIRLKPKLDAGIEDIVITNTVDPDTADTALVITAKIGTDSYRICVDTSTKKDGSWMVQTAQISAKYRVYSVDYTLKSLWNPKSGELQLSVNDKKASAYLMKSGKKITFRIDDIAQLLTQLGADAEQLGIKGSISIEFSTARSIKKPDAVSVLEVKDKEIHDFVRFLKQFDPFSKLSINDNRLIDEAGMLSPAAEAELQEKINEFIMLYEVDLVYVMTDQVDDLTRYTDDYYFDNFYGLGKESSGYIVVCDASKGQFVVRAYGIGKDWINQYNLDQLGEAFADELAFYGPESAFPVCHDRLWSNIYPQWVASISK